MDRTFSSIVGILRSERVVPTGFDDLFLPEAEISGAHPLHWWRFHLLF
jgi:hypothetical protein